MPNSHPRVQKRPKHDSLYDKFKGCKRVTLDLVEIMLLGICLAKVLPTSVFVFFPQVFQVCLLFPFSINRLGDDCAAISSTAKAVVSLVEAVLQEFPNGCGRAKNADCIEDIRTAITCFTLWLNLQMEPFANCHDHASYQYLTPVIL